MVQDKAPPYATIIFILCASFCAYEFILRVKIGPLSDHIQTGFHLSANDLGLLSAAFFLGYAPIQLLAGPIILRFGAKKILTIAIGACALSTLVFSTTHIVSVLFIQRLIAGIGGGFAYVGAYLLIASWYPYRHWAFLYGLLQLTGCLGAMYGQQWLAHLTDIHPWRGVCFMLGLAGLALTGLFFLLLKDKRPQQRRMPKTIPKTLRQQFKKVTSNRQSYLIASYAFLTWGPIAISASLWGPLFLAKKLGISVAAGSYYFSYTWLGVALGSPLIGYLSTRVTSSKRLMLFCAGIGFLVSLALLSHYIFRLASYPYLLALLGFAAAAQPISFVKMQQVNPNDCRGVAVGFNNMAVILSGVCLLPLSSYLVTHAHLQANPYQSGLQLMPICFGLSFFITMLFIQDNWLYKSSKSRMAT